MTAPTISFIISSVAWLNKCVCFFGRIIFKSFASTNSEMIKIDDDCFPLSHTFFHLLFPKKKTLFIFALGEFYLLAFHSGQSHVFSFNHFAFAWNSFTLLLLLFIVIIIIVVVRESYEKPRTTHRTLNNTECDIVYIECCLTNIYSHGAKTHF